ncbi:MAG: hypothetical protein AAB442_00005 [Patescibacteria group bacterium]
MDILSHGLWGSVAFGRKNRRDFWASFFFGVAPDLFSFGLFTLFMVLGLTSGPEWVGGPPPESSILSYVHTLYDVTHSLIVFALVYLVVFAVWRKHYLPLFAWPLHILVDIPTHSAAFFPTPFLWPLAPSVQINGIPWAHPIIFIPNIVLLVLIYFYFFYWRPRQRASGVSTFTR